MAPTLTDPRWVRDSSRARWAALGADRREELFRLAREGEPYPDLEVALAAVHWSYAVLGRPDNRRRYPWGELVLRFAPAAMYPDIYNGTRHHDMRPVVRRTARAVEAANTPALRAAGIDPEAE